MLSYLNRNKYLLGRISFFIIFFWFGYLKIIGVSPADGVVKELFNTLSLDSILSFESFFFGLGVFEMIIGIGFLVAKFKKIVLSLFLIHMFTTFGPVILNPDVTWQSFGVLTLEGQYIMKNLIFVIAGVYILGRKN